MAVIVCDGRPDLGSIRLPGGIKPDNVKIENFIPFEQILHKVDVFVTNGGFGSVNLALSKGVPMVIGGDTEERFSLRTAVAGRGPESILKPAAQLANRFAPLCAQHFLTKNTKTTLQDCRRSSHDITRPI